MNASTALLIIGLVGANGELEPPVTVSGLSAEYCPQRKSIRMVVTNGTETMLFASVLVQRRGDSGEWQDFSEDVLGTQPFPKQVISFRLAKGESTVINWRPLVSSNARRLDAGSYRVLVNTRIEGRPPGKRSVVAHFEVRAGPGCAKSKPTRSRDAATRDEK